jgi:hypothetical protein
VGTVGPLTDVDPPTHRGEIVCVERRLTADVHQPSSATRRNRPGACVMIEPLLRRVLPYPKRAQTSGPPIDFAPGDSRVVLEAHADSLPVAAVVRASLDIALGDALALFAQLPATLVSGVSRDDAEELADRLRAAGATVVVCPV